MLTLLMSVALMVPQQGQSGQGQNPSRADGTAEKMDLDGNWTVLCYEKDGQPVEAAKDAVVTIKDNMVQFQAKDGTSKIKSMKLQFDRPGHLRVTETDATSGSGTTGSGRGTTGGTADHSAKAGVYVHTKDYLAVCVHDDATATDRGQGTTGSGQGSTTTSGRSSGSEKGKCTVILKKTSATGR